MSDSNRVAVRYTKESTPGVTPATPVFQSLCHTGTTLALNPQTVQSEKICGGSSRGVRDLPLVGIDPGGDVSFELEYGALDGLLDGVMQSAWGLRNRRLNKTASDPVSRPVTNQITDIDTNVITFSSGTVFAEGAIVRLKGFTNAANNGLFVVGSTPTATTITLAGLEDETPPDTAEIHDVGVEAGEGDIKAVKTGGNALTSTVLDFTTLGLAPGDWIKIGGSTAGTQFATAALNTYVRVSAVAANQLDLDVVPTGWADDDGSGKTIRLFLPDTITDGVAKSWYTVEKEYGDHSPKTYEYFRGQTPETLSLQGNAREILTGSIGFVGLSGEVTTTRISGASTVAGPGNDSLQTSSNVGRIAEGGTRLATPNYVTTASLQVNNNLRRQNAWGESGSVGVGTGDFGVTGQITTYFGNAALLQKLASNTESSLDFAFQDARGQALLFDLPRIKYASGVPDVSGRNTDVTLPLDYQGLHHDALGYTLKVCRFHAAT